MPTTPRDDIITELKDDLTRVRAELADTNSRLAWLEGYVDGRDSFHGSEFADAVAEGLAASRRDDVVSHDDILDDIRDRRSQARTAA